MAPINTEGTMTLSSEQFGISFDEIAHREDMRVLDEMGAEFERADRERASLEEDSVEDVRKNDIVRNAKVYDYSNDVKRQHDLLAVRNIGDRLAAQRDRELTGDRATTQRDWELAA